MNVESVMSRGVATCRRTDSLAVAAKMMWDHDCGAVPVVDDQGRVVGMLTDRDCLMAAFTRGRRLDELSVQAAMAHLVFSAKVGQSAASALVRMQEHQVRRLPVVDEQGRLAGVVSLADLVQASSKPDAEQALATFAAVTRPRSNAAPADGTELPTMVVKPKKAAAPAAPRKPAADKAASSKKAAGGKKKA